MSTKRARPLALTLALAACPGSDAEPTGTSSSGEQTTGSAAASSSSSSSASTGDVPTTGEPTSTTDATTDDATTGEPTTGDHEGAVTRIVYGTYVDINGQPGTSALRHVSIVDGVAAAPVTLLDPPGAGLATIDATLDRSWSPYYSLAIDPPQLWLLDTTTLTPHEVALPPAIERVVTARLAREDRHLIVWGAPLGSSDGADYRYYVCELGRAGECTLALVEPATGPTTYVESINDISSDGKIWYTAREIDGTETTVLQGDVAAPEDAEALGTFSTGEGLAFISKDEKTAYFVESDGDALLAMDISVDPPGPLVEIHAAMPGVRRRWSDDEKDLLLHVADGQWGDLFHLTIDGTEAGPIVQIEAGGAEHVAAKSLQWIPGRRVLFMGDQDSPMANQLYLADVAAPAAAPVKLSGPLQPGGELDDFHLRGDAEHLTYYASPEADAPDELFRARIDPPGEIHKLNGPQAAGSFLLSGAFDAATDGTRVVYAGSDTPGRLDLFLVELDGEQPAAPVNLTGALPADTDVALLGYLSPDNTQVFFRGRVKDEIGGALYMVQLVPEVGAPVQLSADGERLLSFSILAPQ